MFSTLVFAVRSVKERGAGPYDERMLRCSRGLTTALRGLALVWLSLASARVFASGAHAISFLEKSFVYEHEETSRKIFRDAQQSDRYFAGKVEHSTRVFFAALPRLERFLSDAKAHGIELVPLALRTLGDGGETSIPSAHALCQRSAARVPMTARLPLDTRDNLDALTVSIGKALDEAQARWLWAQLPQLSFAMLEKDVTDQERTDAAAPPKTLAGFGAVRLSRRFALWVGSVEEIRPQNEAAFRAQADTLADEIFPALEAAFADDARRSLLVAGDTRRLVAPQSRLRIDGASAPFNPYGPLLDEVGMRVGAQAGRLQVRVLLVVDHKWGEHEGDPQPDGLQQYLQALSRPAAVRDRDIDERMAEVRAARPDDRSARFDPLLRLAKDPVLRSVGGQRVIDALTKDALQSPDASMRRTAIEQLRWIDAPERDRVYFELLRTRRYEPYMAVLAQSFGERPDDRRVDALLAVWRDATTTDEARAWAKNGLRTAVNYLAGPGQLPLKRRIEDALGAQ